MTKHHKPNPSSARQKQGSPSAGTKLEKVSLQNVMEYAILLPSASGRLRDALSQTAPRYAQNALVSADSVMDEGTCLFVRSRTDDTVVMMSVKGLHPGVLEFLSTVAAIGHYMGLCSVPSLSKVAGLMDFKTFSAAEKLLDEWLMGADYLVLIESGELVEGKRQGATLSTLNLKHISWFLNALFKPGSVSESTYSPSIFPCPSYLPEVDEIVHELFHGSGHIEMHDYRFLRKLDQSE